MNMITRPAAEMDGDSFQIIAELAYRESGLTLVREKSSMICSRLRPRLQALQLPDFAAYGKLLQSQDGAKERRHLISALTTNVSHFFREEHHYKALRQLFRNKLPGLRSGGEMRLWSAGCSNGQEALSAAITLLEAAPGAEDLNVRILGTDIDTKVVGFARAGIYSERLISGVPDDLRKKYFDLRSDGRNGGEWRAKPILRRMIRFNELNLLGAWPMTRHFDVIFCRNVVIYFDIATQQQLWPRFRDCLVPDSLLFLGHSERIASPKTYGFESIGPTTYRPLPR